MESYKDAMELFKELGYTKEKWAACVWWMLRVCGVDAVNAMKGNSAITYCGGGAAASLDALALTLLGGRKVAVHNGSLTEWAADPKLPMEKDTPAASREP